VPAERSDPVALPQTHSDERVGQLSGAAMKVAVAVAMDRPVEHARYDLALAVPFGGMVENPRDAQRPVLHQAMHGLSSRFRLLLGARIVAAAPRHGQRNAFVDPFEGFAE